MAGVIDVAFLPPPTLLDSDYARIKADRLASLVARFAAAGIPFDVENLETDPAVILQEEDAYRQSLDLAAINDAARRVLAAWAKGADLDQLVALNGTARLVVTPANRLTGAAAVMESDGDLLLRFLAGYSAPAAGSRWGYIARARAAYPALRDVAVFTRRIGDQPRVYVVILGPGGEQPADKLDAVYAAVTAEDASQLTAAISVQWARLVPWSIQAELEVPSGPSAAAVEAAAANALVAFGLDRLRIGKGIPANAPAGRLYVPNVRSATLTAPFLGIEPEADAAPIFDLAASRIKAILPDSDE